MSLTIVGFGPWLCKDAGARKRYNRYSFSPQFREREFAIQRSPNRIGYRRGLRRIPTGLRLSFGRAWIGVIGGELLANPKLGLGEIIFNAREFLDAGVMLSTLVGIGSIGVFFERFVFQTLEALTVRRWGMVAGSRP